MHPSWWPGLRGALLAMGIVGSFISCGGTSSARDNAETPATAGDVKVMCQAGCDHDQMCRGSVDPSCLSSCIIKLGPPDVLSREALALYAQCAADPACRSDDECELSMGARDPAIATEVAACGEFLRSCPSRTEGGLCLRIRGFRPEVRAKWKACYAGTCADTAQFLACLEAASQE